LVIPLTMFPIIALNNLKIGYNKVKK